MSEPSSTPGTPPADDVAAAAPAAPAKPALPPKPAPAKPPAKAPPSRRIFLVTALFGSWFAAAWTTFTMSMLAMTLGTVRFLFPNVLSEPPAKFKAGLPDSYEDG